MNIGEHFRDCVVFLCTPTENDRLWEPRATAFLVSHPSDDQSVHHFYLVTAKHNLRRIASHGGVYAVSLNKKDGTREDIPASLTKLQWHEHPSADIAVANFDIHPDAYQVAFIPSAQFENNIHEAFTKPPTNGSSLELGMDVFIPGLFSQYSGKKQNLPVIRTGRIAMLPQKEAISSEVGELEGCYLIEARSTGGLSGSPVFYDTKTFGGMTLQGPGSVRGPLGVIHGHWRAVTEEEKEEDVNPNFDENGTINMGIAVVTPAIKVWEALMIEAVAEERKEIEIEAKLRYESGAQAHSVKVPLE